LKDIYITGNSNPEEIIEINGTYYFTAVDAEGRELWKSQGTPESTVKIKDIASGSNSSNPLHLTNVNGTLYFSAEDGIHGIELWKSDGTTIGTQMVKDIKYSTGNSDPSELTNVNGILYFSANDGNFGEELWKSDGTQNGTVLVEDINFGTASSNPEELTNVNGTLFYVANDGKRTDNAGTVDDRYTERDLWKTDSQSGVTKLVRSFEAFGPSFFQLEKEPKNLFNHNGTLVFNGYKDSEGEELWRSDGTLAGTVTVENFASADYGSHPSAFATVGSFLYFSASFPRNGTFYLSRVENINANGSGTITDNLNYVDLDKSHAADPFNIHQRGDEVYFNSYYYEIDQNGNVTREDSLFWVVKNGDVYLFDSIPEILDITTYDRRNNNQLLYRVHQTNGTEELKITDGTSVTDIVSGCGL